MTTRPPCTTLALPGAALALSLALVAPALVAQDGGPSADASTSDADEGSLLELEKRYYVVEPIPAPPGEVLEVGGLGRLSDGRLVASTRRGQVWLVDGALDDDPSDATTTLFAEGLQEGLGLCVVPGEHGARDRIFVVQRGELSELVDDDGDDRCDTIRTICNDWGLSGNYHEFAFGLPRDARGRFYVSLNVGFLNPEWWHGKSIAPYRGWLVRINPSDGAMTPIASGFRSPCGLGLDTDGTLYVTDNQGDWMPTCGIFAVHEGGYYGHPASLAWTDEYLANHAQPSDTMPPKRTRDPAAVWIPYAWSRSTGNLEPDTTAGRFGPFAGQLFAAELTNGELLRVQLEEVRGRKQGAVFRFRRRIGSLVRVLFTDEGTLVGGMTNRGWGGLPPADGLVRIRWTGELPLEMHHVHLLQDGFEITFTKPLDTSRTIVPDDVTLTQYDYDSWWEYGSPERHTTAVPVTSTALSADGRTLTLRGADLVPGMVARVALANVRAADGSPLLHDEFAYTINQLPEGPLSTADVAKTVPPPPPRTSGAEGWLRLTYFDALDAWEQHGWQLVDAELDPEHPRTFMVRDGVNALVDTGPDASEFTSRYAMGDGRYHVEFMLPEGGRAAVYVQGRYGIALADDTHGLAADEPSSGALLPLADGTPSRAPAFDAYKGPGTWHALDVDFVAPRFDASGEKLADARFANVLLDDVLIQEDVALPACAAGRPSDEVALGPLVIAPRDGSPLALRTIQFRPVQPAVDDEGWVSIFNGDDLDGWRLSPGIEDPDGERWEAGGGELVGRGDTSHLFSPRGDYRDFELRAKVMISDGGNSGLYFRVAYGPGWPKGYEAQVNASMSDPQKTGSLYDLAPVHVELVPPDTWFDYHVTCRDESEGTHVTIAVDGVVVTDFVDTERRHASGHIALQQHHQGSVVRWRDIQVKVLD
ncbi:MAG: DUF1080 domain-containing protein [Planctomycetes bacterium]|nr:DUF1080 domain-containing protein [Planctomycetota bacterium]